MYMTSKKQDCFPSLIMFDAFTVCTKVTTYLHCQTQFQSLRTGWGLSSVICPSSSSIRASVSGGAHSWSRSVAARMRFPEDTKKQTLRYTPHVPRWQIQYTEPHAQWLLHNGHVVPDKPQGGVIGAVVVWINLFRQSGNQFNTQSIGVPCGSQARL